MVPCESSSTHNVVAELMAGLSREGSRAAGRLLAVHGAWVFVETLSGSVLGVVLSLVLARMVGPENYGLVGMALAVVIILKVVVTEGFALAIVQRTEISDIHLNSVFWVNMALGAGIAVILFLTAPLLALALGDPRITSILRAISIFPLFSALAAVPSEKLRREFRFRWLALRPVFGNVLGGCLGIGLALNDFGLWSLVAFQLTREVVIAGVVFVGAGWLPRAQFDRSIIASLARFSINTMGARFVTMSSQRMWVPFCGAFLGPTAAGYLRLAEQILMAVQMLTTTPVNRVALPTMSRAEQDRSKVADLYLRLIPAAAGVVLPLAGYLLVALPEMIELTYGLSWLPAAHAGQIMMFAMASSAVTSHTMTSFISLNLASVALSQTTVQFIISMVCYLATAPFGIIPAAAGFALRGYLGLPHVAYLLSRHLGVSILDAFKRGVAPATATFGMIIVMLVISWACGGEMSQLAGLVAETIAGFTTYFLILRLCWPQFIEDAFHLAPERIVKRIEQIPVLSMFFLRRKRM